LEFVNVLVSDFDGTMTRHDFYKLAKERLLPSDIPDFFALYRAGSITHFEALRRYFTSIRASEEEVKQVVFDMELDPDLLGAINRLKENGWRVIVASAGCEWYIRLLLNAAGIDIEVHANPGRFVPGNGLVMELPLASPYFSSQLGVDKSRIVASHLGQVSRLAFAGDGFPDVEPSLLVQEGLRFARADLADVLTDKGHGFHRYGTWSEIADFLCSGVS
jgi:2-hydroxy-3-keto-5-methylthiopentenyl-1-phosphate phosphatase